MLEIIDDDEVKKKIKSSLYDPDMPCPSAVEDPISNPPMPGLSAVEGPTWSGTFGTRSG